MTQAVVWADFASSMNMGGCAGYKTTCEGDKTCSLYVALVVYKRDGELQCDYVRWWSSAPPSAAFHHHVLHKIHDNLVGRGEYEGSDPKVPRLARLRVWCDGDGKAFKGHQPQPCCPNHLRHLMQLLAL